MKSILAFLFSFALVLPAGAQVTPAATGTVRSGMREDIQNLRTQANEELKTLRENFRQQLEDARMNFQKTIEAERTDLQTKLQAHRDELKNELQKVKDEGKKTIATRIDGNVADLNARMTAHYTNVLDQIAGVLGRVVSRADKAQTNGLDVTAVRTKITTAQTAITAARAAVAAQVSKMYSMNITSDATLKNNVSATRKALHDDLKKVEDSVKAARDAVRQAAVTLAQIRGVDEDKSTSTATSTDR